MNRAELTRWIREQYGVEPEYPWPETPRHGVFRHPGNRKWFAIIMDIPRDRLEPGSTGRIDVVNLKGDPMLIGALLGLPGIYPAYHMNKTHWISVALDGRVDEEQLKGLLAMSRDLSGGGRGRRDPKNGETGRG
ncbi:MAG: MmcQ/YjbR family DNA-binding protein [Clostridiales bacterium]|jgi:predicted DNA-binding protein (MmcQ/YjbR family)|nr:MmcQ/YjbR family DNA-binding protein [Bacillota bacterium]NLL55162.1 MmcQ/YjbR family DNA-binding protein [Clostridiales bacterium]